MSEYNILQAIYMSFYSKRLYRDVAKKWSAKAFLYLLVIIALSWIVAIIEIQSAVSIAYKNNAEKMVRQIPIITLSNGELKTPEDRPYIIYDPSSNQKLAVIDTSGQYKTLEAAGVDFLLTKNELMTQPKPDETRTYKFPTSMNLVIAPEAINKFILDFAWIFWICLYFLLIIGAYTYRLIQALIYAIFGKIMASLSNITLSYEEILKISMVAVTPAIILAIVLDFFKISFAYQGFLYFLITMFYLFFGIKANKGIDADKQVIITSSDDKAV